MPVWYGRDRAALRRKDRTIVVSMMAFAPLREYATMRCVCGTGACLHCPSRPSPLHIPSGGSPAWVVSCLPLLPRCTALATLSPADLPIGSAMFAHGMRPPPPCLSALPWGMCCVVVCVCVCLCGGESVFGETSDVQCSLEWRSCTRPCPTAGHAHCCRAWQSPHPIPHTQVPLRTMRTSGGVASVAVGPSMRTHSCCVPSPPPT